MPRQHTPAQQLVRYFSAAGRPIYLVDDRRVIVYCNPACAAWAGLPAAELIGQTCVYGAPAEGPAVTRATTAAAGLCPPPGALAGATSRGCVSAIDDRGELVFRQAEFLPLSAGALSEAAGFGAAFLERCLRRARRIVGAGRAGEYGPAAHRLARRRRSEGRPVACRARPLAASAGRSIPPGAHGRHQLGGCPRARSGLAGRRGAGNSVDRGTAGQRQGACCQGDPLSSAAGVDRRSCRWPVLPSMRSC